MQVEINLNDPRWDTQKTLENLRQSIAKSRQQLRRNIEKPLRTDGGRTGTMYELGVDKTGKAVLYPFNRNSSIKVPGILHRSSAIGEVPAPVSTTLANSWTDREISALESVIESAVEYASILQEKLKRDVTRSEVEKFRERFVNNVHIAVRNGYEPHKDSDIEKARDYLRNISPFLYNLFEAD